MLVRTRLRRLLTAFVVLPVAVAGLSAAAAPVAATAAPAAAPTVAEPAPLPPLGWNSWNTYFCRIDETKIKAAADALVSSGMAAAGYRYVVVDDCWQATTRASDGSLRADPTRFPSGMKALGDYIHARGLKFGIYQAPREKTCAQYFGALGGATGALGHEVQDANTFASWGVDYLKYDWCSPYGTLSDQVASFTTMRDALRSTGRPIVYSINPNSAHGDTGPSYDWGQIADMWRTAEDITDSWSTGCTSDCAHGVTEILDIQAGLTKRNGPGRYNDPDMLEVGVRGTLTPTENRAHFSMWALMASPLIAGNDIATMPADVKTVLTEPDLIAIDQDPLALQATRVRDDGSSEVWSKRLSDGSYAVGLLNRGSSPVRITTTAAQVGLSVGNAYTLYDVWTNSTRNTTGEIASSVPAHGTVVYRVRVGAGTQTTFALRGAASRRCVDVLGGAAGSGTQTVLWDCGTPSQVLALIGGTLALGGTCMDVFQDKTADGTAVITWECNGQQNQQWILKSDGSVRSAVSGKCLTANGSGNNQALTITACNGGTSQRWTRM